MTLSRLTPVLAVSALMLSLVAPVRAAEPTSGAAPGALHSDVEIDPTAYALGGYSLHAGVEVGRVRVDLGAYSMKVPGFVHGNEDFDVAFDGYGAKLQLFPLSPQRGLFVGVDGGVTNMSFRLKNSDLEVHQTRFGVGADAGYRIMLPASFYVTPWIGVGYSFQADDVHLGGKTFAGSHVTFFPAIHLGHRFD